jgi:ParB family chromosome partitioning protein
MSLSPLSDKFHWERLSVQKIKLRDGSQLPGGQQAVTRKILRDLVGAERDPILVIPFGDMFQVIAGDIEYLAAVGRGETIIDVQVGDVSDQEALLIRLSQAGKRGDVNAVEEAEMFRELNLEYGMTQQEIAMRCGRVQSTVANKMRLLKLPSEVLDHLRAGNIGERHARALLKLKDENAQIEMLNRCLKRGLSASEVEDLCTNISGRIMRRRGRVKKGIVKDFRIYKNTLRSVVKEMRKAGLDVVCDEESDDNSWEFRILLKEGETT